MSGKETKTYESSDDDNLEYIPKPLKRKLEITDAEYIPSSKNLKTNSDDSESNNRQKFIVTLDGVEKTRFKNLETAEKASKTRRTPSPIIFDKPTVAVKSKSSIPDKLPKVNPPLAVKNKEKCKYWPNCRQGEKCEFVHPTAACKTFPQCKFGEKCLYIHPSCKFESSCTRRDCPYSHVSAAVKIIGKLNINGINGFLGFRIYMLHFFFYS